MTRIAILTTHPPGQSLGTSKRVVGLAQGLRTNGVESVLLSPYPGRPAWWEEGEFVSLATSPWQRISGRARLLALEGFYRWETVRRFALGNPSRIRATVQTLALMLAEKGAPEGVDILQGEQQVAAAAACSAKRDLGVPVVADIHNVWAEELEEAGLAPPGSPLEREARALDTLIAHEADGILVPNGRLRHHFVDDLGADAARVWVVPTGATPHVSGPSSPAPPPRLVYSGTVTPWVRLEPFIEACALLRRDGLDPVFYATNRGPGRHRLRRFAHRRGVRLELYWLRSEEEYFRFLATCHVGIVPWTDSGSRAFAVPGKMYDYFAAALPVVATGSGEWAEAVRREALGQIVTDDPAAIAAALRPLLTDEARRQRMGSNGLAFLIRELSWSEVTKTAAAAYETLRSAPRASAG